MESLLAAYWLAATLAFTAAAVFLCARLFPGFWARGATPPSPRAATATRG